MIDIAWSCPFCGHNIYGCKCYITKRKDYDMPHDEPVVEKKGIKETKEVLVALNEVVLKLYPILKDGLQIYDDMKDLVEAIMLDGDFRQKIADAADRIMDVQAEIEDLDFIEGIELIETQVSYLKELVEMLKE